MSQLEGIQQSINEQIKTQLERFHCSRGHLRYQSVNGSTAMTLNGWREEHKPVLIWQTNPVLGKLIGRYLQQQPSHAGLFIEADLSSGSFVYQPISRNALRKEARVAEELRLHEEARQKQDKKNRLQQRTDKFGTVLAGQVADVLHRQSLAYSHRDYCGMGLELRDGFYMYGEVQDGCLQPSLRFGERAEFVEWLSGQSDASLARLEENNAWYWGNQVINRERLEDFVSA